LQVGVKRERKKQKKNGNMKATTHYRNGCAEIKENKKLENINPKKNKTRLDVPNLLTLHYTIYL